MTFAVIRLCETPCGDAFILLAMTSLCIVIASVAWRPCLRSPPLRRARATSPASPGEHTPGRAVFTRRKKFYPKLKKIQKKLENRNA